MLEVIALKYGYKIYNHECYVGFLKHELKQEDIAKEFDGIRKIRNSINYYGSELSVEDGAIIINDIKKLIMGCKILLK